VILAAAQIAFLGFVEQARASSAFSRPAMAC
jgi:hypothetical protein